TVVVTATETATRTSTRARESGRRRNHDRVARSHAVAARTRSTRTGNGVRAMNPRVRSHHTTPIAERPATFEPAATASRTERGVRPGARVRRRPKGTGEDRRPGAATQRPRGRTVGVHTWPLQANDRFSGLPGPTMNQPWGAG